MCRKRKRSAWRSVPSASTTTFDPPRRAAVPPPPNISSSSDSAPSTPLVLPAEHIRAMQRALGLTPERSDDALVFLHPATERTARAMLPNAPSTLDKLAAPRPPRRLSAASAVTPIAAPAPPAPPPPLPRHAHSPQRAREHVAHASRRPPASPITPHHPPTARALFAAPTPTPTSDAGASAAAPPAATSADVRDKAQPPRFPSLFATASGKRLSLPPASAARRHAVVDLFADCAPPPADAQHVPAVTTGVPPPAALFTTGSGKPLPPPSSVHHADPAAVAFKTPRPRKQTASLFTTASGKSVPIPPSVVPFQLNSNKTPDANHKSAHETPRALAALPNSAVGNPHPAAVINRKSPQPSVAPFSTPSPLPRPRPSHIPPSSAAKWNPSAATSSTAKPSVSSSLFLSAAQSNAISAPHPSNSILDTRSASRSRSLPSPQTPSLPIEDLRKALFPESARNSSAKKAPDTAETPLPPPIRVRRRRSSAASTTRTTPFKRPRRLVRPSGYNSANKRTVNQSNVPQFSLPLLLTNGLTTCTNPETHNCPTLSSATITSRQLAQPQLSILQSPTLLLKCHDVTFRKHEFGHVSCLPPIVANALNLVAIEVCDVSTFVQWTRQMFPAVESKPASCVGSEAWTRMAYSLAVYKLMILQSTSSDPSQSHFFCAANVVREFMRRLSVEWHHSKQPHLLRIMRNDSSPSSHIILRIVGIEPSTDDYDKLSLVVSDGWYVARCSLDETLHSRVWRGRLRVGDKVSLSGSTLQTLSASRPFFFGDADELGASYLRITANGLHKAPANLRLGIRKPTIAKSLKPLLDGRGTCPPLHVVILRTYPVFYKETIAATDEEEKDEIICRREEGEDEARSAFEEKVRREIITSVEKRKKRGENADLSPVEVEQRCVSCVKDMLVGGVEDDPSDSAARKLIRIYNAPESLQSVLKEGQTLCLTQVWPRPGIWICKPEAVRELRIGSHCARTTTSQFVRKICSVVDLQNNLVQPGEDFDGVFAVLHVTPDESNSVSRFVYLTDDPGNDIRVLALELCDEDAKCLPRALRFRGGLRPRFPLLVMQDAEFKAISKNHDLVHAKATLRSSLLSARATRRQRKRTSAVKSRCEKVESHLRGKEEQLEILREAVISFVSGETGSIGAYFTSTQDM